MVGRLKDYKIKDQTTYDLLKSSLTGIAFFRKDEKGFFVKSPSLNIIKEMIRLGSIVELSDDSQMPN
jgi:hypothetical protein